MYIVNQAKPDRVSTTPGNPGNLLEFKWSSWKFLCNDGKFLCNDRPHWYPVITLGARLLLEETGPPILSLIWPHVVCALKNAI